MSPPGVSLLTVSDVTKLTVDGDLSRGAPPLRRDVPGHAGEVPGVTEPRVDDDEVALVGHDIVGVTLVHHLLVLEPVYLGVRFAPGRVTSQLQLFALETLVGVGRRLESLLEEGDGDQGQPRLDVTLATGSHTAAVIFTKILLDLISGDPPPGLGDPDPSLGVHMVLGHCPVLDLVLTLDIDAVRMRHPALQLRVLVLHHEGVLGLVKEHGQGVVDWVAVREVVWEEGGGEVHLVVLLGSPCRLLLRLTCCWLLLSSPSVTRH